MRTLFLSADSERSRYTEALHPHRIHPPTHRSADGAGGGDGLPAGAVSTPEEERGGVQVRVLSPGAGHQCCQ